MRMRKIIALGVSAVSAAALTLGATASPAKAIDLGLVSGLCGSLPGQVINITNSVLGANAAVVTTNADNVAKQAALGTATTALVNAVVAHILNVNAGNDGGSTAGAVGTAIGDYGAASVAANTSFNKWVDAMRTANALANSQAFAGGISSGLCII
jgi:hypothetical protein